MSNEATTNETTDNDSVWVVGYEFGDGTANSVHRSLYGARLAIVEDVLAGVVDDGEVEDPDAYIEANLVLSGSEYADEAWDLADYARYTVTEAPLFD